MTKMERKMKKRVENAFKCIGGISTGIVVSEILSSCLSKDKSYMTKAIYLAGGLGILVPAIIESTILFEGIGSGLAEKMMKESEDD